MKTITITEEAYNALKAIKGRDESFSEVILRKVSKKRPDLMKFYGIFKGKAGEDFERDIMEHRKRTHKDHEKRMRWIIKEFENMP